MRCVIEALDLDDVALVGFSVGGAIAVRYMARHEGFAVTRLVLAAAAAPLFTQRPDYPYGLPVADVDALIEQTFTDRPKMVSDFGGKFFGSSVSSEFREWFNSLGLEAAGHSTAKLAMSLRDEDLREDAPQICVPTAIFSGVKDQVVPFANAQELHAYVPGSVLVPFRNSGHGLFYDEMDKFNSCLVHFLSM